MKTTDEIYDLLVQLDKKVDTHIAVSTWRLNAIEDRGVQKGAKRWQLWTAIAASPVAGAVLALFGFKAGA